MDQTGYLLCAVDSESIVRHLKPDFTVLRQIPCCGIIVTAPADSSGDDNGGEVQGKRYDIVSRFFAPTMGIDEDPVTGSAHCTLAPFWRDRLQKDTLLAYQASHRGGVIRVHYDGGDRVILGGQAITVLRGELV
jgi:predicted PhzF superfamily epimerase YddE/YHI9